MMSVGELLKNARTKRKVSLETLSVTTKIRKEFLDAIEKGEWNLLPEFPVVLGFVKSIASTLKVNPNAASALLKRDYPPKTLRIIPKPDVSRNFVWSPKFTFWLGIGIISLAVIAYLGFQYITFISAPGLFVEFPTENQRVTENEVFVSGKTDSDVTVKVNNQPVLVDDDGNFSSKIEVGGNTSEVVVVAKSRSGKETVVSRKIEIDLSD